MAIAGQTEIQKSMPDRAKLAAMSERTVQVVQLLAPNKPGKSVISAQKKASMDWIDELPNLLQQTWGAGTYKVEVYEESGPEKDVWTVKVGSSAEEESPMNGNGTNGANGFRPPIDGGASGPAPLVQLGHGYFYNEALGLLTTPQKQIIPWRQGDPWPAGLGPVPSPQQPYAGQQQSWGTPWGVPPGAPPWAQQGWGGYPATTAPAADDSTKRELEAMKEALRVSEARAQDAERRREADAQRALVEKAIADSNARTEAVLAELREMRTAKPTGPDPAVAEMQRRLEESERRHAEDLRRREESETRVRAEAETRDREARMREEMKVNNARFEQMLRELSAQPKTDPMMTMLLQVVTGQQTASAEAVKAIGESTRAQLENARAQLATSSMTPEKMVAFMETLSRTTQGTSGELNRNMIGMFNELFSMSQNMLRMQLEGAANAAGPAWLPVAQQGLEQIGKIAQVYAVTQARAQAGGGQQQQQQRQRPPQQQQMQRPPQQQMQQAPQQQQLPPDPRAAAAAQVFGPVGSDGKPVGRTASDQVAAAMAGHPAVTPIQAPPAAAAPGPAVAQPAPPAAPPVAAVPAAPPAEAPRGRRGGRRRADDQQQQQPAEAAAGGAAEGTEAADPFGAVPASQIPPDAIRSIVANMDDETLFAEALTQINVLRNSVKEGMPLEEIVNAVLTSRQYFQSFGINPPCLELLNGGHVDVLVIRLLPEATPEMWQQVADGIRVALRAEAGGGAPPS